MPDNNDVVHKLHIYTAEQEGKYLSMSMDLDTKTIEIHEMTYLKVGETMIQHPRSFIMMLVSSLKES
jgi:hypothetical protein